MVNIQEADMIARELMYTNNDLYIENHACEIIELMQKGGKLIIELLVEINNK